MSYLDLVMLTSGFMIVAFASIVTIRALGKLLQLDWSEFLAALGAIGIASIANALGCFLIWEVLT